MQAVHSGWNRRALIILAVCIGLGILLWWRALLSVLTMVISASLLAALMLPITKRLETRMKPNGAAALSLVILVSGLLIFIGLIAPVLSKQAEQLLTQIPSIVEQINHWTTIANERLDAFDLPNLPDLTGALKNLDLSIVLKNVVDYAGGALGHLAQWMLVPMLAFYFLKDRERFGHGLTMMIPVKHRRKALLIAAETKRALLIYMRGHAIVSLFVGAMSAVGLLILGVPSWLALGVWIALTDLIPYFGPLLGVIPIILFGATMGISRMLWALGIVFVINQVESNFVVPNVVGEQTGIHPVTVLVALLLGNLMFGLWGIILSLPALIVGKTVIRTLQATDL